MIATDTTTPTVPAQTASAPRAPRMDFYAPIHRALRSFMTDTLVKVGHLDPQDPSDVDATLAQLNGLLLACRSHLEHENEFVHPAIEARRPGISLNVAAEHEMHLQSIAALQAEAATLAAGPTAAGAARLYRHLALFVAENFEHMEFEETVHNQALWAAYSDEELMAIEQRLVASIPPEEMSLVLRWMVPALPPVERALFLGGLRAQMPAPVFDGILDLVRPTLDDKAWAKLALALQLPARPWSFAA